MAFFRQAAAFSILQRIMNRRQARRAFGGGRRYRGGAYGRRRGLLRRLFG